MQISLVKKPEPLVRIALTGPTVGTGETRDDSGDYPWRRERELTVPKLKPVPVKPLKLSFRLLRLSPLQRLLLMSVERVL